MQLASFPGPREGGANDVHMVWLDIFYLLPHVPRPLSVRSYKMLHDHDQWIPPATHFTDMLTKQTEAFRSKGIS